MILSVILSLLKIILIIVLVILVLIILLLADITFSPFIYKMSGKFNNKNADVKLHARWLLGIITVNGTYSNDNDFNYVIRVFGININFFVSIFNRVKKLCVRVTKKDKHKDESDNNTDIEPKFVSTSDKDSDNTIHKQISEDKQSDTQQNTNNTKNKQISFFNKIIETIKDGYNKMKKAIKSFKTDLDKIVKKISGIYEFMADRNNKKGFIVVLDSLKKLLKHIKPHKFNFDLSFGMEDPYKMGQVLSLLGIFYPLYGEKVDLRPCFDEGNFFDGAILVKGRIRLFTILVICIKLYYNDDFKMLYKSYKESEMEV